MKRRDFIRNTAILAAAAEMPQLATAATAPLLQAEPKQVGGQLIITPPALQNYAETSMGVAFGVSDMANGFVLLSEWPDMRDAKKVMCGGLRVTGMNDRVMQIRLTGLKPATTYYFQIGADHISYKGGYQMKILGTETDHRTYSFTTAGRGAKSHFCVMNDTHAQYKPFDAVIKKIVSLKPSCIIHNGDALNSDESIDKLKEVFLAPPIEHRDYAAQFPLLFTQGNHENRGLESRHLENVWMYRQPEERASRDWDLGRNFAVRMGDIAMIGLDTGEDKLDTNPLMAGLFAMKAYREAQTLWLADALKRKEIASAPYLVTFCHIPLFESDPKQNPGDLAPADKHPDYTPDFASWQRTCANMWVPLLEKAKCQLVITAHMHRYRFDAPTANRRWAHLVGGGPENEGADFRFSTVIEGLVEDGLLKVRVHNIRTGQLQAEHTFKRR